MGTVIPKRTASGMRPALVWAGLLLGAVCMSCGNGTSSVNDYCPGLDNTSGGNPLGTWKIDGQCQVQPQLRATSGDWCSKLVYDDRGIKDGLVLGQDALPIVYDPNDPTRQSILKYEADPNCGQNCGTYSAKLVFQGPSSTDFPLGCLTQHEAHPSCSDLQVKVQALVDANVLPTIQNVQCGDDGNGGCLCSYLVSTSTIAEELGSWRIKDGLLVHYPQTLVQPSVADFSITGNTMQLHGHDGTPLLTHDPLRTLVLTRQ